MKLWVRLVVVACLSLVLPLQALAGAAMLDCTGTAAVARGATDGAMPFALDHAMHEHAAHGHAAQHAPADGSATHGAPGDSDGEAPAADCSRCGVCHLACTGGLTPFLAFWQPMPVADVLVPALPAARADAPAHRLLRPPRTALA